MRGIWNRLFPLSKAVSIVWTALVVLLILFPPNTEEHFLAFLLGRYVIPILSLAGTRTFFLWWQDISLSRMIAEGFTITIIAVALIAVFQVKGRQWHGDRYSRALKRCIRLEARPDDNDG